MRPLGAGDTVGGALATPARIEPLSPADLRWRCDPAALGFATTNDVAPLDRVVGQDRGLAAIAVALEIDDPEYNVFVAGPSGSGRSTAVMGLVKRAASRRPTGSDLCYLHSFDDPYRPILLELPAGQGRTLEHDLDDLVARCRSEVPKVFEGAEYERRRAEALKRTNTERDAAMRELAALADSLGFAVEVTPVGIVSGPLVDGKPLTPERFELLTDERKRQIAEASAQLRAKVDETVATLKRLDREGHEALHAVDRDIAVVAVGQPLDALRSRYAAYPVVLRHLEKIQEDIVERLYEFRSGEEPSAEIELLGAGRPWIRYGVNVAVARQPGEGAPVESEPNPTLANLIGRVDYRASVGAMHTDFRYIRAGALHRANGGYLVLQARDVLTSPYAYEALKRALRDHEVRIENPIEQFAAFPAATLKPEPAPLDVRVVLIGDLLTYTILRRFDPDFARLFKIKSEFTPFVERTPEAMRTYAGFVAKSVRDRSLPPFTAEAVARVVEEGARLVEHRERLAGRLGLIEELIVEAAQRARGEGVPAVRAADVERAVAERRRRGALLEDEMQRAITDGTIAIDTHAKVVGQVLGLSVVDLADYAFARPSRITARTAPGTEGVIDIEREVELSGPTHSKGVLILAGYLRGTYGQRHPLGLSAHLTFEQSYGGVEGDSASSSELLAILSSLADAEVDQGIAVTGSVDQRGRIQAVGAVNEKIEGHFAVCRAQGLTGTQGVVIPASNVRHLMLDHEVVDAVASGTFHVWAIERIDDALELLTGQPAGEPRADGSYPEGTLHARVEAKLSAYAEVLARYARASAGAGAAERH